MDNKELHFPLPQTGALCLSNFFSTILPSDPTVKGCELATPYCVEEDSAEPLPATSGLHSTTISTVANSASASASSGSGEFSPSNRA